MKDQAIVSDSVASNKPLGYEAYLAEREEILRNKWFKSEFAGRDVGWEVALLDWVNNYRADWLRLRSI